MKKAVTIEVPFRSYTKLSNHKETVFIRLFICVVSLSFLLSAHSVFAQTQEATFQSAENYLKQGEMYADSKDFDHAIESYNKAIQLKPNYAEAYNDLGHSYYWRGNSGRRGDYERAIEDFIKAIELRPDYPTAFNNLGAAYMASGNPDKALTVLTTALKLNPDLRNAYVNRANVHLRLGHILPAFADFHKAGIYSEKAIIFVVSIILLFFLIKYLIRKRKNRNRF